MGANSTREFVNIPKNDIRRRSFDKPKAKPEVNMYNDLLALKGDIDQFNGTENENQYKIYAKQLAGYSKALQDIKSATTKRDRHEEVDRAQQIINSCFVALHSNKMNERNLDHAAIESHSFINGSNPSTNLSKGRRNQRGWRKLENVQVNIRKLQTEVNSAIELEDMGKFKFLEEKIKLLLADIDTIPSEGDEGLFKKKDEYSNKLLDTFKRMKGHQRRINRNSKSDLLDMGPSTSKNQTTRVSKGNSDFDEYNLQILKDIESKLVDLEVKILEFEDTTKDDAYRELRRHLTKFADQVNGIANVSGSVKTKQDKTIDLIEVLLNKVKRKALKNESILQNELKNIAEIEDEVTGLERKVKVFTGKQTDQEYKIIDQGLRKQWDRLSIVIISLPTVKNYKDRVVSKIKDNLKTIHDKTIQTEAQSTFNTADSQNILEQTTKFEIHWNIIQYSIDSTEHSTNDLLLALTKLEEVNQKISSKCKELQNKARVKDEIKFDIHPGTYGTLNDKDLKEQNVTNIVIDSSASLVDPPPVNRNIKPMSSIDTYGKLQSIIRDVTSLNKTIDEFHGTNKTQRYQEIYMLLKERQECLQSVDDLGVSSLQSAKTRGHTNIQHAFERLQKKVTENESIEETSKQRPQDEITEIAKQLRKLRKRVECYSGVYKDATYVEIEDGLQECWGQLKAVDVGDNTKILTAKNQTEEKICTYLQNLDEKSAKIVATEV